MISGLRRSELAGLNASTLNVSPINGTSRTLKNSGVMKSPRSRSL
jgi:hypothetical protein